VKKLFSYFAFSNDRRNSKLFVYLICVLIASVLWFANALGNQYETIVNVRVNYTNIPDSKVLVNSPPRKLEMKISGHGFALLRHKLGLSITPINFNMMAFTNEAISKTDTDRFTIVTERYVNQISRQMSSEVRLVSISPDTISFQFDHIQRRKIPIRTEIKVQFEKEYFQWGDLQYAPDSIWVEGPKRVIDTLQFIPTEPIELKNVKSTLTRNVSILSADNIKIATKKATVTLPVSQFTEYIKKIEIEAINLPDSLSLVTFPGKVSVNCMVPLHEYRNILPSGFSFVVDFNEVNTGTSRLRVVNLKQPKYVQMLKFQPDIVDFIISGRHD
jgi:YbbR domain-containing protein